MKFDESDSSEFAGGNMAKLRKLGHSSLSTNDVPPLGYLAGYLTTESGAVCVSPQAESVTKYVPAMK